MLSDVHANLPALEAVLGHGRERDVDAVWNAGDTVGYGAFPNEVIERLRHEKTATILGNYDGKVLRFPERQKTWRRKKPAQKFLAFQWAHQTLTKESFRYLSTRSDQVEMDLPGRHVLLTHGSPASPRKHLTSEAPRVRLSELTSAAGCDIVVCGHSHRAFVCEVEDVLFINPGSVGRPDDGDPRASYAIADFDGLATRKVEVRHYRVSYDVERAAAAVRKEGLPEAFAQMAILGLALDEALEVTDCWGVPASAADVVEVVEVKDRLNGVLGLAERCGYETDHTHHVTHLCLRLFDELRVLHRFGPAERFWLRCAALLHDIGWIEGRKGHHKASLRLIFEGLDSGFGARERSIIGSTARYHRGALAKGRHEHFSALSPVDQYRVTVLAGLLRVADGLDRTHRRVVQDVSCEVACREIHVICEVRMYPGPEREGALDKGQLLERALDRKLVIGCRPV